jgi:hypothetical protein
MSPRKVTPPNFVCRLFLAQIVVREKILDGTTKLCADKFRNVSGEHNVKATVIDVPSHQVFRVRIKRGARSNHTRAWFLNARRFFGKWRLFSSQDDGRSAISKQPAGYKISHRVVVLLPGQRTEFNLEIC